MVSFYGKSTRLEEEFWKDTANLPRDRVHRGFLKKPNTADLITH